LFIFNFFNYSSNKQEIMENWFSQNIGKIITAFMTVVLFAGSLIGYIYTQDKNENAIERQKIYEVLEKQNLLIQKEVKERKREDEKLNSLINMKLDLREFNQFEKRFESMQRTTEETNRDVKQILKKF